MNSTEGEARLRLAASYLKEASEVPDFPKLGYKAIRSLLGKIQSASSHILAVRTSAPEASFQDDDGQTQDVHHLSRETLLTEGLVELAATTEAPDRDAGIAHLANARKAIETALTYGDSAYARHLLAQVFRLEGNREGALAQANEAVRHMPTNELTLRFADELQNTSELKPYWPEPTPEPRKPWPLPVILLAVGLVSMVISSFVGVPLAPILSFGGFGLWILAAVIWWKTPKIDPAQIPGTYEHYRAEQHEAEFDAAINAQHAERYRRERAGQ